MDLESLKQQMRPKIKELALQAGGSHYPEVGGKTLEKFAELIMQECLGIIEDEARKTHLKKKNIRI